MKYTRIYRDTNGESHFDDVAVAISPKEFAPPAPPLHLAEPIQADRTIFCAFPKNWFGDWHPAPRRQFYFQISGEIEVQVSDGEVRRFTAGSVVLLEDTSGKGHATRVVGDKGVEALFVQLPTEGDAAL